MNGIDARGLACSAPVLQTKAYLEEKNLNAVRVVLDNAASQQNVQRFLDSQGFETVLEQKGNDYVVIGNSNLSSSEQAKSEQNQSYSNHSESASKIMVMCATNRMGFGDDALSLKLMINFLRTLKEMGADLWRLVFVNNGVKLTIEGSEVLEDLKTYEASGLKILVCGTCLDHFSLLEKNK